LVCVQSFCDDGQMTEIDVIGRLVQDQEMWLLDDESGVAQQSFLSLRERINRLLEQISRQQKR
jgi:hypothetical protein